MNAALFGRVRAYTVFNVDQIDGLRPQWTGRATALFQPWEKTVAIVAERPNQRRKRDETPDLQLSAADVRIGSFATETRGPREVRFPPNSDRRTDILLGPEGANRRLMHRSRQH